ncbi:MAG TPA: cysteine dioxygenase family protein [Acidimicrobiia bacterium]|jgi:mannose-6-phosphate isomerase-like protein (cupin superfamily)
MTDTLTIAPPATVAKELARTTELWWPKVRRSEGRRWYELLLATEDFEAWLLGWPVGEGIELHDHGSSSGAFIVVEGTLSETYLDAAEGVRPGSRLYHRLLPEGDLVAFGPDHIHDVVNGGRRQAMSIHVYSPRLRSMTFYEARPDRGLAAVRTEVSRPDLVVA